MLWCRWPNSRNLIEVTLFLSHWIAGQGDARTYVMRPTLGRIIQAQFVQPGSPGVAPKELAAPVVSKTSRPVIPAIDDVINRSWILKAKPAGRIIHAQFVQSGSPGVAPKELAAPVVSKTSRPVIPAIDDVINRSWKLKAKPAGHATRKAAAGRARSIRPPLWGAPGSMVISNQRESRAQTLCRFPNARPEEIQFPSGRASDPLAARTAAPSVLARRTKIGFDPLQPKRASS